MSPQLGDDPAASDPSRPGGLGNVFRGLGSSKSSKSPALSSPSSSSVALPIAELVNATPTTSRKLSPNHMEALEVLKNGSPNDRIAAANGLKYAITEYPLNPVLEVWYAAKDLIDPAKTSAARTAGWELLTECVKHASSTDLERKEYFQTLSALTHPDDFHLQLAAMVDLTNHGRVVNGFDYELFPVLAVWLQEAYKVVRTARRNASQSSRGSRNSARSRAAVSGEEKNLTQLFSFLTDVIKFSFNSADEPAVAGLIDRLVSICMSTSVEDDLRSCISVIDTIVTFGSIPSDKLKGCVQILSSIFCLVPGLQKDSWRTLSHLFKSHNGQATVRILLDLLRSPSQDAPKDKDFSREIRGALAALQKLLSKSTEKGYPAIPFALLVDGLSTTAKVTASARVCAAILQLVNFLFADAEGNLHHLITDEDWSMVLEVAAECSNKVEAEPEKVRSHQSKDERPEDMVRREMLALITRLDDLIKKNSGEFVPRQTVINFFINVNSLLSDSAAQAVLDYFQEFRCCSPSDLHWEENLTLVLDAFLRHRSRSPTTRLRALQTITESYEMVDLVGDEQGFIPRLAKRILEDITEEEDAVVLDGIMSFMVTIATTCDMELFDYILNALKGILVSDNLKSPISPPTKPFLPTITDGLSPPEERSPSNVATIAYVKMFAALMNSDSAKAAKVYTALVGVARSIHCAIDARLTAMKLLFRLRADWAHRIFITSDLEACSLAATVYRTEESLAKKQSDDAAVALRLSRSDHGAVTRTTRGISFGQGQPPERGHPVRTASGTKGGSPKYHQLWKLPDPGALPDNVPTTASPVLVSHVVEASQPTNEHAPDENPTDGSPTDENRTDENRTDENRTDENRTDDDRADEDPSDETKTDENPIDDKSLDKSTPLQIRSINATLWLETVLAILVGDDWEIYSFVLVHLPSQLTNHAIFKDAVPLIRDIRKLVCDQIRLNSFQEPPNSSGLRRADVAICLFQSLTMVLSYHEQFQKGDEDEIVRTFVLGISTWERTAKCCIHGLSICCHELPLSASKNLIQILNQMAAIITQPHVSIHILEFLACLSRLHSLYVNFREDDFKTVFAICFRYLDFARDKSRSTKSSHSSEPPTPLTGSNSADLTQPTATDDLPQYVYALAYHVILFWFLAVKLPDRAYYVGWIAKKLFADVDGSGPMADEYALTTIDFMQRVAYADVDESAEDPHFTKERFGEIEKKRWLVGNSMVTIKQATTTGWAQIIKRQASGTSAYTIRESYRPPPLHQAQSYVDIGRERQSTNTILPSHLLVQLISPIPQSMDGARPIPLPDDEATERAVRVFDRSSTVDGHKVGVIYIGEGQTQEQEILSNVSGSSDYVEFLNGLGTLTKLKGAAFNTQGLDHEFDSDGEYTFCWRDRVTEIIFHVTTQMPTNLERDPQLANKKRHIGNDFVNIIFNDSGLPFKFDTFPSQFNSVNIVITPASRASFIATREANAEGRQGQPFYKVHVMGKPGFPDISPASETKMVSLPALPGFIRLLALNASVFSLVWESRGGGEHVSSWRSRLREIKRLREKHSPRALQNPLAPSPPPSSLAGASLQQQQQQQDASRPSSSVRDSFSSLRRTSVATFFTSTSEQTSHRSSMLSTSAATNDTETGPISGLDSLVDSVDFSKWA